MAVRYYQVPETFSEWRRFVRYSLDDCAMVFCRMNENISGVIESMNIDKKPFNVTRR